MQGARRTRQTAAPDSADGAARAPSARTTGSSHGWPAWYVAAPCCRSTVLPTATSVALCARSPDASQAAADSPTTRRCPPLPSQKPGTPRPAGRRSFRQRPTPDRPAWVFDGNYGGLLGGAFQASVWAKAGTVGWLDYPLPLVMRRVIARTARRWWR